MYPIHSSTLSIYPIHSSTLSTSILFTAVPFQHLSYSQQYPANIYPIHSSTLSTSILFTAVPCQHLSYSLQYPFNIRVDFWPSMYCALIPMSLFHEKLQLKINNCLNKPLREMYWRRISSWIFSGLFRRLTHLLTPSVDFSEKLFVLSKTSSS